MADDQDKSQKTEQPSQRKLDEAQKKGDSPRSQEIPGWFVLASGLFVIAVMSQATMGAVSDWLRMFLARPHDIAVDAAALPGLAAAVGTRIALSLGALFGVIILAAIAGNMVQTKPVWTFEKVKPKLSKLSPVEGAKRLFGPQALVNFLKGVAKMSMVAVAVSIALWPRREQLLVMPQLDIVAAPVIIRNAAIALMIAALIVYSVIAAADYVWQRHSFMQKQKMSRRELKEEMKNTEGDPHVKAKLRQIRQERGRRRMLAEVPDSTVVIANPTHYAVALKYERGETPAPICVAKGVDALALRIREVAEESGVSVIEDPPLARALHATAELDEPIPEEHFQAVAQIIGQIMALAKKRGRRAN